MDKFVSRHPFISLCAVVWIVCGFVSIFLKSEAPLETATAVTILIECLVLAILCFVSPGNSIVEFLVMLVVTGLAVWFTREKKKPEN